MSCAKREVLVPHLKLLKWLHAATTKREALAFLFHLASGRLLDDFERVTLEPSKPPKRSDAKALSRTFACAGCLQEISVEGVDDISIMETSASEKCVIAIFAHQDEKCVQSAAKYLQFVETLLNK